MEKQEITDRIMQLTEDMALRARNLKAVPGRDLNLEIDLIMDDLRLLYRQLSEWKKQYEFSERNIAVPSFFSDPEPQQEPSDMLSVTSLPATEASSGESLPSAADMPSKDHEQVPDPIVPHEKAYTHKSEHAIRPGQESVKKDETLPAGPAATQPRYPEKHKPLPKAPLPSDGTNSKSVIDLFTDRQSRAIGDAYGQEDNSLHQRISSQKEDKSIGTRLQQHPVQNIRDAIGVNEKFLFINELFRGDLQLYNDAISQLNDKESLQQAFDYLNVLSGEFGWDSGRSSETIEKLAGIVQRRYSPVSS